MALSFVPLDEDERPDWITPTQWRYLAAVKEHGSARAAERALGLANYAIGKSLKAYERNAARRGLAPGHFINGVAAGYAMGKVTVQRNALGEVERTWERQSPEDQKREALIEAIREAVETLPRLAPIAAPAHSLKHLLNLYIFTDYHLGMRAWAEEGGSDWNLEIAEAMLVRAFEHMIASAPASRVGFIGQLGDFLHFDSLLAVTPTSKHVLDASSHYKQVVRAAIRVMRRLIDFALHKHESVVVLAAEGNHDLIGGGVWLPEIIKALYENEPRVVVIDSATPYYAYQWGVVMLAFHHGHIKKLESLPLVFAERYASMWGGTTKRYAHAGHYHHEVEKKDVGGMRVTQHPTLAPNDSHSARGGYPANQQTSVITYHDRFGKAGETVVTPEMLEAFAA